MKGTLGFDWEFGHEELTLRVDTYANNGRLYVGLFTDKGEPFGDLTANLPSYSLEANEAFIDGDSQKAKLAFIKKHKLGKVLRRKVKIGYAEFPIVAFDMERLKEFDRVGIEIIESAPKRNERLRSLLGELGEILEEAPNEGRCGCAENEMYKSMEELHYNLSMYFRSFM